MDFSLKCNSLKCRTQLTGRAVVTTCSHIFCEPCAGQLGLTATADAHRTCPACQIALLNPDDAVLTELNPSEDYKTSVLSGFNPTTIVECAGRGLAFWHYQSTQEIVYQEYLAKTLTDKYQKLDVQIDKVIHDANTEIENLNQRLAQMQVDQDKLKADNSTLASTLREKSRKNQQLQELYDRQKRKEMTAATQSAAFDSVDEVLQSAIHSRSDRKKHGASTYNQYPLERGPSRRHRGPESLSSGNSGHAMPPPLSRQHRPTANQAFRIQGDPGESPQHRTRLGVGNQQPPGSASMPAPFSSGMRNHPQVVRRPLSAVPSWNSSLNNLNGGGFGLTVGMKRGTSHSQEDYNGYR